MSNVKKQHEDGKNFAPGMKEDSKIVVYFLDTIHGWRGDYAPDSEILNHFRLLAGKPKDDIDYHPMIDKQRLEEIKHEPLFRQSMIARGHSQYLVPTRGLGFTQRQMMAASIMLNIKDRRSDEKKLRDIGVSTAEWTTWLQDRKFTEYVNQRAELLLGNAMHEAHLGLIRGVQNGNVAAIKLYYEITDRYNPDRAAQVNIQVLLNRVMEAVQRHVKDPTTLAALGADLSTAAIESGAFAAPANNPPVARAAIPGTVTF